MKTATISILTLFLLFGFAKRESQESVLIHYREYDVQIRQVKTFGDTIRYNRSSKEDFKLVIFESLGKSYLERYLNGQLIEAGHYENSLDTLKRYVGSRDLNGNHGPLRVVKYFEPLKHGIWLTYKNGKIIKRQTYNLGVSQH